MPGVRLAARLVLAMSLLVAGCGGETAQVSTVPTTLPPASTTGPATATTRVPSTTEPGSATTTTGGPTTTTTAGSTTTTTLPPWGDPGFPEALPPEAIPWDEVGAGWLLVRYREPLSDPADPAAREALFLINPADIVYAVSEWDSTEILDWSPGGRRVLVFDGRLRVIDLREGSTSAIPAALPSGEGFRVDARFTRPLGRDVVVRILDWDDHVRLETLQTDGTRLALLADFDLPSYDYSDPEYVAVGITWLYAPTGTEVVVATSDRISLLSNLGAVVRPLDTPGLGCTLSRWWDERSVLAACYDRDWAASPCWYQGPGPGGRLLWSVPIDGSRATRLTPEPVCTPDTLEVPTYGDGLPVGRVVAAQSRGCCGCGGSLDFIVGDSVTPWTGYADSFPRGPLGESQACSPYLIAARGEHLVVGDTVFGWDPDHGATGWLGALFEVAADGTTRRAITPVTSGHYGGVLQVFTNEEAALTVGLW